jgi:hypothetical protein
MRNIPQPRHFPISALIVSSAAVVACITWLTGAMDFRPYFGNVPPTIAAVLVCVAGFSALYALHKYSRFSVYSRSTFKHGLFVAAVSVIPFMIGVTVVDVVFRFPFDINVAFPSAILFYPAMGFLAQITLHVVPFAILLSLGNFLLPTSLLSFRLWGAIVLASLPEAAFQVVSSMSSEETTVIDAFVAVHLFLFGVVELYLYRRFDYATMYAFRIFYYCYWHLAWGNLRIYWLF